MCSFVYSSLPLYYKWNWTTWDKASQGTGVPGRTHKGLNGSKEAEYNLDDGKLFGYHLICKILANISAHGLCWNGRPYRTMSFVGCRYFKNNLFQFSFFIQFRRILIHIDQLIFILCEIVWNCVSCMMNWMFKRNNIELMMLKWPFRIFQIFY